MLCSRESADDHLPNVVLEAQDLHPLIALIYHPPSGKNHPLSYELSLHVIPLSMHYV